MSNHINTYGLSFQIKPMQEVADKRQKTVGAQASVHSDETGILKRKDPKRDSDSIKKVNESISQWTRPSVNTLSNTHAYTQIPSHSISNGVIRKGEAENFEKWLNIWAKAQKSGDVKEAVQRMRAAFYSQATELSLDGLELTSLPSAISQLSKLKVLNLEMNKFQTFPLEILTFSGLENLSLASNHIKTIPAAISKLSKLKILHLCVNELKQLPQELGALSELEYLDVNNNGLIDFPSPIGKLSKLKTLDLSYNKLRILPVELRNLFALECFQISENPLVEIPLWISGFSKLRLLGAERIRLSHFPAELCNLPLLEELYLSDNELNDLPPELGNLQSLIILEVGFNLLRGIPKELGQLKKLAAINIEGNETLSSLPQELNRSINLASINCYGTPIPQQTVNKMLAGFKMERDILSANIHTFGDFMKNVDRLNAEEEERRIQAQLENPFEPPYTPFEDLNNYLKAYSPLNYK